MIILYASQTGNAEDIGWRISRKLQILKQEVSCFSLSEYRTADLLKEDRVVFVCSTTGQGEVPDDMKRFWKCLLIKNLPPDSLTGLHFCTVGLGDSSYEQYNVVAKKLRKRLLQLGAREMLPIALFDDQHELGYDAGFDEWLSNFLKEAYPFVDFNEASEDFLLPARYQVCFLGKTAASKENVCSTNSDYFAELKCNDRITSADHFQDVRLLKFGIDDNVSYSPGDVACFLPENDPQNVEEFVSLINWPNEEEFILKSLDRSSNISVRLPSPCTIRSCATSYWDIQGIPKRSFFDILWHFSKCDIEKEKLKEFASPEGREELYSYCNRPRRSILEVLQDFPNTTPNIPLEYYFELIPAIRARSFSIASSLSYCPRELDLLVAVVNYRTRLQKPRVGLCSTWLSKLDDKSGVKIPFTLKSGALSLPAKNVPIIMVGPGTGCAPFRGFIQQRISEGRKDNYLFFGCRYKEKDFLCKRDWRAFIDAGMLTMFVAFSRDQEEKIYVQDRMREQSNLLWKLIHEQQANVYVAGNSKAMPTDVKNALKDIICKEGEMDISSGEQYLKKLEASKRLQMETWS